MNRFFGLKSTVSQLSLGSAATVFVNLSCSPAIAATLYNLTDLGALTGGTSSYATAINNNGQVVGQSASGEGFRAFLWSSTGGMVNLGSSGSNLSYATGISDSGQVVGYATVNNAAIALQWDGKGSVTNLSPNNVRSYAYSISNTGQIAGYVNTGTDSSIATVWQSNQPPKALTPVSISSIATGINDKGQSVGQIDKIEGFRAALWSATGDLTNLGTLGGNYSYASGINDRGQVVGYSTISKPATVNPGPTSGFLGTTINAFIWNASTGMTNLGSLSPQDNSYATGINENSQVIGYSYGLHDGNYRYRAFTSDNGIMTDLNRLIDPTLGWALNVANAVNDKGQIVGLGVNAAGQSRAFLLTPQVSQPPQLPPIISPLPTPPNPAQPPVLSIVNPQPTPVNGEPESNLKSVPEATTIWGLAVFAILGYWRRR